MEATVVGHRVLQELHRRASLLVGVEVVLRAGIEGSNSSHEAMAAANQLVDRFQRSTQGVQATELMRQWRESSSYQWARSHNQRGLESIESNWREAEELHQRAEHSLQHAEVYRRAAENAQRLVQQGRTDLTTGIAQFAYATGRGEVSSSDASPSALPSMLVCPNGWPTPLASGKKKEDFAVKPSTKKS